MKYLFICFFAMLVKCDPSSEEWKLIRNIDLGDVTPIGLTILNEHIWISDGDHNQLVAFSQEGTLLKVVENFERPMHIDNDGTTLFIPEYGSDNIIKMENGKRTNFEIPDSLDAPAGIAIYHNEIAIADFYNHRILFYNGDDWMSIGKEGKAAAEFYYPTDIFIGPEKIFVADAYNNRIQIFDKKGNHLQIVGAKEKINAATGIFATLDEIFITDFENDRVLSFDHKGKLKQVFTEGISKPTDILVKDNLLYIANYKGKNLLTFKK